MRMCILSFFLLVTLAVNALGDSFISSSQTCERTEYDASSLIGMSMEELMNLPVNVAGHMPITLSDVPVTTRIIQNELIRSYPYRSLVDALKFEPGFRTSQPGNGWEGDLFLMRGLRGNYYAKILLDGIPISPSVANGMPLGEQLFIQGSERIEILYGPASALYGADAVAGVINIVPHEPLVMEFQTGAMMGQDGYGRYYFDYHSPIGTLGEDPVYLDLYGLFSQREDTPIKDGYDDVYARQLYQSGGGSANRVPFALGDIPSKDWSAGIKLRHRGLKVMYDRMYRSDHSSLGQQTESYFYDDADAKIGETIDRLAIQHEGEGRQLKVRSTLSYLRYRLDPKSYFSFIFPLDDPDAFGQRNNNYKYQASDDLFWEEVLQVPVLENWLLSLGFSSQHSKALPKSNDLRKPFDESDYSTLGNSGWSADPVFGTFGQNEHTYHQTGLFAEGLYQTDHFDFQAGIRYDSDSRYGDVLTHRLAGQFMPTEDTAFRISYGEAYKAPSGYLAYNSVASVAAGGKINYITVPNPNLGPEQSQTVEVGFRHAFTQQVMFDVATYVTEIRDMIRAESIPVDENLYPDANNTVTKSSSNQPDKTRIYGLQAVLSAEDLIESIGLDSSLSLDYLTGRDSLPSGEGHVDSILMSPEWMLKWRISMHPTSKLRLYIDQMICTSWRSINVRTRANYDEPYYKVDGYYVMDLAATYSLSKHAVLFAQLQNVWDETYGGIDAYGSGNLRYNPQMGRSVYAGVEFRF